LRRRNMGDNGAAFTPMHGLARGMFEPGAEGYWAGLQAGAAGTPGANENGATPGSMKAPGKLVSSVQPSQRWVIYYDKNGNELQRKTKGPGRLPRGAYLDDNQNYIVRDCIVNKNTQEVMTVPAYVPPERKHERTGRSEAEQFMGFDFLAVNPMAAPVGFAARPPPRAVRLQNHGAPDEDNPYAKFRGGMGTRLAERESEAQQLKGSAAYTKRLKSPWYFPALVPPEDRDTYDRGYSLHPGGGRGDYATARYQMPGKEYYALTLDGRFQLLPPCSQHNAGAAGAGEGQEGTERKTEGKGDVRAEESSNEDARDEEQEREGLGGEGGEGGGKGGEEQLQAIKDAGVSAADASGDGADAEAEEDAFAAKIIEMWQSLGSPGAERARGGPTPGGGGGGGGGKAMMSQQDVVQAAGGVECAAAHGERNVGVGFDCFELDEAVAVVLPGLWHAGKRYSLVQVFLAVASLGGCSKVHAWSLVGDALVKLQEERDGPSIEGKVIEGKVGGSSSSSSSSTYTAVAERIRKFVVSTRLEEVEARVAAATRELGSVAGAGGDVEMWEAQRRAGGGKMVVMLPQGTWVPYGEELVLKEDGLLHHAQVKEPWYSFSKALIILTYT
jgi:hypothetical protein